MSHPGSGAAEEVKGRSGWRRVCSAGFVWQDAAQWISAFEPVESREEEKKKKTPSGLARAHAGDYGTSHVQKDAKAWRSARTSHTHTHTRSHCRLPKITPTE